MSVTTERHDDLCSQIRCSAYYAKHFDALRCVAILHLPIYPVRMEHVKYLDRTLSDDGKVMSTTYQVVPMRWAIRNVLKAYLGTWPYFLLFFGPFVGPAFIILCLGNTVGHHVYESPSGRITLLVTFFTPLIVGAALTPWYWIMERKDHVIKEIVGETEMGVSDPYYWPDETILAVQSIRQAPDLRLAASLAIQEGDYSTAMMFVRMAQRIDAEPDPHPERDLETLYRRALPREFAGS